MSGEWRLWQGGTHDTEVMSSDADGPAEAARAAVIGLKITAVFFLHDFIEVHMGKTILTSMTKFFGMIGCQGVEPSSIVLLIGHEMEDFRVVDREYVAIDSGENRIAFPIVAPTATAADSVMLVRPAVPELGVAQEKWVL
jgi:hypothetical protein